MIVPEIVLKEEYLPCNGDHYDCTRNGLERKKMVYISNNCIKIYVFVCKLNMY